MARMRRSRVIALLIAAALVSASCAASPESSPVVCQGVTSDAGGCTIERHAFVEETCDDLARAWAIVVDNLVREVIAGPESVGNQSRSVRLKQAVVISTIDVNDRLRILGSRTECDADAFLRAAEPHFSALLRAEVGRSMYDGDPVVGYQDWLADVAKSVKMIDRAD